MAFPVAIDPATPAGTDPVSGGDDQIRALKQAIVDLLGLPTSVAAQPFYINAAGLSIGVGIASDTTCAFKIGRTDSPGAGISSYQLCVAGTINKFSSGTHALFAGVKLDAPTIGAGAATLTEAATLYITGAPSVGDNQYALHIDAGNARWDGILLGDHNITASAEAGSIVLKNNVWLRSVNAAGTATLPVIRLNTLDLPEIANFTPMTLALYYAIQQGLIFG